MSVFYQIPGEFVCQACGYTALNTRIREEDGNSWTRVECRKSTCSEYGKIFRAHYEAVELEEVRGEKEERKNV